MSDRAADAGWGQAGGLRVPLGVTVRRALHSDLDSLVPMYEAYCRFYEREPGEGRAAVYLADRMNNHEAVVFIAEAGADADGDGVGGIEAVGFALLYPKWQSTAMRRDWLLNDLFVVAGARRRSVARALLAVVDGFARDSGALKLQLKTHYTNEPAQRLYEGLGWVRKESFWTYERSLRD